MSDVPFYHDVFVTGIVEDFSAYCDFWFPYPPLSLPLMYLPGIFGMDYGAYRRSFQLEMLIFDVAAFIILRAFLKNRITCSPWRRSGALTMYSLLGLTVGHLMLDRLDIAMSVFYLGALYFYTAAGKVRWLAYVFLLAGALVKLLPLFLLPLFAILECYRARGRDWPIPRMAWTPFALVALPFAVTVLYYHSDICDRIIQSLSQHGSRGIQIESNWALPLVVAKVMRAAPVQVDYSYGAFHIFGQGVPEWWVWLSKRVGFALLGAYYFFLYRQFRRKVVDASALEPADVGHLCYGVILILIATQRVLSPQYLIWLMPLAAIQLAVARRPVAVLTGSLLVFGLSYVVFDIGFHKIIDFDPAFSLALIARNALLALWTVDIIRRSIRGLRIHRRSALPALLS